MAGTLTKTVRWSWPLLDRMTNCFKAASVTMSFRYVSTTPLSKVFWAPQRLCQRLPRPCAGKALHQYSLRIFAAQSNHWVKTARRCRYERSNARHQQWQNCYSIAPNIGKRATMKVLITANQTGSFRKHTIHATRAQGERESNDADTDKRTTE